VSRFIQLRRSVKTMALAPEARLGQWSESNAVGRLWLSREAFASIKKYLMFGEPFLLVREE
jgi:hypothetical protein